MKGMQAFPTPGPSIVVQLEICGPAVVVVVVVVEVVVVVVVVIADATTSQSKPTPALASLFVLKSTWICEE